MAENTFEQQNGREEGQERKFPIERPPQRQLAPPSRPGLELPQSQEKPVSDEQRPSGGQDDRPQQERNARVPVNHAGESPETVKPDRSTERPPGSQGPEQSSEGSGQGELPEKKPPARRGRNPRQPRQPRQRREERTTPEEGRSRDQRKPTEEREPRTEDRPRAQRRTPAERRSRDRGDRGDRRSESRPTRGGKDLSVVIPLYNEEGSLRELYDGIKDALSRFPRHELIFVDDGSTDGSARVLQELRSRDRSRIKIIRFRRNYGKSAALSVGFGQATGEVVVTMDADLQDDPAEIPSLVNEIRKGFDLVSGWKKKRFDPITKTIPSRLFNFITSVMTGIPLHDFNCGLKAYRSEVVKEIKVYGELHRYIPVLAHWMGYKIGEVVVKHRRRKYGKTKFGVGRFWKGFLDLITVLFTTRYLRRPLHLFGFWGMSFFLAGFLIDLYLVVLWFTQNQALSNRPLFLGGILLIIVGVQFISIGLLGEMIIKTKKDGEENYSIREMLT